MSTCMHTYVCMEVGELLQLSLLCRRGVVQKEQGEQEWFGLTATILSSQVSTST